VNRVDHDLQYAEETLVGILRVVVHDQAGRLRNVGEQDRYELALAVEWSAVRLVRGQFSIPPSNQPTQRTRRASFRGISSDPEIVSPAVHFFLVAARPPTMLLSLCAKVHTKGFYGE
jgi:hypothetical protein